LNELEFCEEAENQLIDKALHHRLTPDQRQELQIAMDELRDNPLVGQPAVLYPYFHKRCIGDMLHITFYYDLDKQRDHLVIKVLKVSLTYDM